MTGGSKLRNGTKLSSAGPHSRTGQHYLALTMKTFVLIVTFAATTDLIGGARTERIASFDDYQACASAGRALYPQQHWECVRRRTSTPKTHQ